MSQLQHTPGPWLYGANECEDNDAALAICKENIDAHTGQSSGHFFVVYVPDGRRTALVGHGPDGEANARLIAAAPELLEQLATTENMINRSVSGLQQYCVPSWVDLLASMQSAIAKATGQSK